MHERPEWVAEIRQQMKEDGLYTEQDEQCEEKRMEYEKVLEQLNDSQRSIIESYVKLLNRCNFRHICDAYFLGREERKK